MTSEQDPQVILLAILKRLDTLETTLNRNHTTTTDNHATAMQKINNLSTKVDRNHQIAMGNHNAVMRELGKLVSGGVLN